MTFSVSHICIAEETKMKSMLFRLLFLACVLCPAALFAQDTATITGTVTDPTGAAVANAQVTIVSPEHGVTRSAAANGSGDYLFPALPVGSYDMTVTAQGFKKYQANGIKLDVGQKARNDVRLEVGAAQEQVTVEGINVAQVETQSSDLSGTVTGTQISQLQLNGRNFTQLVTLVPGVSNQTGQDEGTVGVNGSVAYSINGGRTEYNNWEIDGGDNMDNGSNSTLNVYPSVDAIAEFKVLTSNYGAQYGRNASGTIEVETKSGTNRFHGTASYFGRNEIFNAYNYFDDSTLHKPAYKKHDFGYTVGGPVFRNKTFFFWSQEWRRERNPKTFTRNVPSDAERAGDFSDLCPDVYDPTNGFNDCPNVANPAAVTIDPVAQALLPMIPSANATNAGYPAYIASISEPTTWREELIRVDHNISPKMRATFRFIHDSWQTVQPTTLWSCGDDPSGDCAFPTIQTHFVGPGVSLVTRLTATVSPTLLNEFVFSYTTDHITLDNTGPWQRPAGLTTGLFQNGFGGKLPGFNVVGGTPYGDGFEMDPSYIPWVNSNPTYTFRDNVNKIIGKHNLQFGAYVAIGQKNEQDGFEPSNNGLIVTDTSSGVTTGNAFADLLMGQIASFQQENQQLKYYNRYKIAEPFFQDDWRVSNKLTLNLGLRVSLFGTYYEKYKRAFSLDPNRYVLGNTSVDPSTGTVTGDPFNGIIQCGAAGIPRGCLKGHLFNPAPRIGFAYDPNGDGKMAIRGGYGVFFEHTNGNEGNTESLEGTPPLVLSPVQTNINGYANVGSNVGAQLPLGAKSIPSKAVWPYVQQWHLDLQKELPKKLVATVSYVGSKGTHLTLQKDLNQLPSVPLSQNPYVPGEAIGANDCGSSFDAFGVPTAATTSNNVSVPYGGLGVLSPAVNLGVAACGTNPDLFRSFSGYSDITRLEDTANSSYHALQVAARRTVGALNLSLAYTYSHAIDNSSDRFDDNFTDSFNPRSARGNSNFDQRHILTFSYVYDLPFFSKPGLSHSVLGGWQWSGIVGIQSGTPRSVVNGNDFSDSAGVANGVGTGSFADIVGDPRSGFQRNVGDEGPVLYNPAAYAAPQGLTFGNSGRNSITLPRRTNFDMALFKRFPIRESTSFEFRWELYNIFNHTQFSDMDNSLTSATFLEATSAHAARIMQFGAKFIF